MDSLALPDGSAAELNGIRRDLVREGAGKSSKKGKILEAGALR